MDSSVTRPGSPPSHPACGRAHDPALAGVLTAPAPPRHGWVSLRRMFLLRWALLGGQVVILTSCKWLGVIPPYQPLLIVFCLQALFNVLTGLRLHMRAGNASMPGDAELMGQLLVDLTALSAILFFTGGATNPFVSFYLPSLAIAAAILPWRLVAALALYALACYSVLLIEYVPLNLQNPDNAINYHLAGMWLNFVASAVMIAVFVARLSGALRQRDEALGRAHEQLLRDARIEALNAQAAGVAHEIGTPLATLAVIAGELRGDASEPARARTAIAAYLEDLRTMEQQIALCTATLARLRADTEAAAPAREIGAWLPDFIERWRLRHPLVTLHADLTNGAAALPAEPDRVGQILTILLDNAARSVQSAGRTAQPLLLAIAREQQPRTAAGQSAGTVPVLAFTITDRGNGMPAALRARLGEAPVTSTHGGQGIGAYLARSAALQMHGSLVWQEHKHGGIVAELRVPAAGTATARDTQAANEANEIMRAGNHVDATVGASGAKPASTSHPGASAPPTYPRRAP